MLGGDDLVGICGGTLIANNWVLTAAHCFPKGEYDPSKPVTVVEGLTRMSGAGSKPEFKQVYKVAKALVHENYKDATHENDIALLKLPEPASSKPVRVLLAPDKDLEAPARTTVVTGWGRLKSVEQAADGSLIDAQTKKPVKEGEVEPNQLMEAKVPLVEVGQCRDQNKAENAVVDNRNLCAGFAKGGIDSCQGDSGGPLLTEAGEGTFVQIGVTSWGIGCGLADHPGVYTRVSAFSGWLKSKMGSDLPGNSKATTTQVAAAQPAPAPAAADAPAADAAPPAADAAPPAADAPATADAAPPAADAPPAAADAAPAADAPAATADAAPPATDTAPPAADAAPPAADAAPPAADAAPATADAPAAADASAPTADAAPAAPPAEAAQAPEDPKFDNSAGVTVGLDFGSDSVSVGQNVSFRVTTQKPGYLVLFDMSSDEKLTQIFPNAHSLRSPTGGTVSANYLTPAKPLLIPNPRNPYEGFKYRIDPPVGKGLIVAILSDTPLKSIDMPPQPKTMTTTVARAYVKRIAEELKKDLPAKSDAQDKPKYSVVLHPYEIH